MKAFLITTQSFKMAFTVVKSAGEFCGTLSAPQHSRTLSSQNVGIKVNIEPRLSIGTLEHRLRCAFSIKLSVFSRNRLISEELFCELLASLSYHEVDDGNEKIIIIKNCTCSTIFGRFFCSHHTTIAVKLDRNGNPIPVPVGSSNQYSLLRSYIVDNYPVNQCSETNRVHLLACSIETFNSFEFLQCDRRLNL